MPRQQSPYVINRPYLSKPTMAQLICLFTTISHKHVLNYGICATTGFGIRHSSICSTFIGTALTIMMPTTSPNIILQHIIKQCGLAMFMTDNEIIDPRFFYLEFSCGELFVQEDFCVGIGNFLWLEVIISKTSRLQKCYLELLKPLRSRENAEKLTPPISTCKGVLAYVIQTKSIHRAFWWCQHHWRCRTPLDSISIDIHSR